MSSNDFYPPEDLPAVIAARERFMADPAHVVPPLRHRKKDGTIIDVEQTVHPIEYRGRPALLVTANDVTARNRVLQELRESEHKYQALVEDAASRHPRKHDRRTHRDRQCRVATHVRLRRRRGSQQGQRPRRSTPNPDDRGAVDGGACGPMATLPAAEAVFRRRDGTLFPVERYLQQRAQRDGRDHGPARHRDRHRAAQVAGGPAPPGAEDGSGRPAHRRHRPRLQQHPDGHHGQRRCAGGGGESGRVRPAARRPDLQGDRPGHRPHAQPACLLAQAAAQAAERRPQCPGASTIGRLLRRTLGTQVEIEFDARTRICGRSRSIAGSSRMRWSISASMRAMPCRRAAGC